MEEFFGLTGFAFPIAEGSGTCDYPDEADVREGVVYADGTMEGTYALTAPVEPQDSYSPADVLAQLLTDMGLVSPSDGEPWPVFVAVEPSSPDSCVTTYDTSAVDYGRLMTGERQEHHGVQIRIRSRTHSEGYSKAKAIAEAMDTDVYWATVVLGSRTYCVQAVSRASDVTVLGKESPTSKRSLFTVNVVLTMTRTA